MASPYSGSDTLENYGLPPMAQNAATPSTVNAIRKSSSGVTNTAMPQNNYVGDLPVNPQSGPATAAAPYDARQGREDARTNWAMNLTGGGAQEAEAAESLAQAARLASGQNKRMDWASQGARALSGAGEGMLERQARDQRADVARQVNVANLKLERALEKLRGGRDPNAPEKAPWE